MITSAPWIVTLPPILVLVLAIATHNVLYSLLGGIVVACFIATLGNPLNALSLMAQRLFAESSLPDILAQNGSYDHAYTFGFLVCLGIIIEYMTHSGGIAAYAARVRHYIHTKRQAETVPLILAPFFFLDDYLNNLVGGSIVRPLFDRFGAARAKLAYLLNAVSSSQCLLVPASSWLAFIVMQLEAAGISCKMGQNPLIGADPYIVYLHTLPYILYPILSIASAWMIVRWGLSYGPMYKEEIAPLEASPVPAHDENTSESLSAFLVPLGSFLIGIPAAIVMRAGWSPFSGELGVCTALQRIDLLLEALWWAGLASWIISSLFFLITRKFSLSTVGKLSWEGFLSMKNSLLLLLFAWTFSTLLKDYLQTGAYLAQLLIAGAPLVIIPVASFITATLITASVGSSWGMIGIMLPLAIPLIAHFGSHAFPVAPALLPLLLPTIGAILSGAAAGPHISPITDAAIISSASAHIQPVRHIRSMSVYSLPALLCSTLGFLLFALAPASGLVIALIVGGMLVMTGGLHIIFNKYWRS